MSDDNNRGAESSAEGIIIKAAVEQRRIRINKWRVREGYPISASQVILLYEEVGGEGEGEGEQLTDKTVHKFKANRVGVVKKRLFKDGDIVEHGAALLVLSECVHTTVIKDMCADCGADLRQNENGNTSEASVPMVHSIPDLKVTQKLAQQLGHADTRRLLEDRKLVLLVDLDQTVIHTTNDNVPNNIKGIYHFQLYGPHSPWYHTRLRPGTSEFLERMSNLYELHICTFGARNYAHMIAQLLDPDGKFFSHRILSRDECFNATSKTDNLKALFPNGDSMVCIIDDREDVWNMASNLIQVKPYHFFQHTGDINAPPGLSKHELDGEGVDFKDIDTIAISNAKTPEDAKPPDTDADVESKSLDPETSTAAPSEAYNKTDDETVDVTSSTTMIHDSNAVKAELSNHVIAETVIGDTLVAACNAFPAEIDGTNVSSTTKKDDVKAKEQDLDNKELALVEEALRDATVDATTAVVNDTDADVEAAIPSTSPVNISAKFKLPSDPQKQIEIEDPDDYLLHLEVILKTIHARFYSIYDETKEIPDLKIVVPKIRSEVLRGQNLVFSGLVPTNMKLEQSRAYFIAKSLGANVVQSINAESTHLVAVTAGTFKVNSAKKNAQIKVVNANWLWSCAERWERVEEKLFPLDRKTKGKQRQPPAHCHSPEHVVNYSEKSEISSSSIAQQHMDSRSEKFVDTLNPLLTFSNADLADMNKDFDQFFESDTSSEDEHINIENPPVDKKLLKRKREERDLARAHDFFTRNEDVLLGASNTPPADNDASSSESELKEDDEEENEDDDEMPSAKFRRGGELPSDLEMGSDSNNSENNLDTEDDGDWNMMGAALEREFLGLED